MCPTDSGKTIRVEWSGPPKDLRPGGKKHRHIGIVIGIGYDTSHAHV